jgi:DNA-binding transcriptional LysR family regulator
MPREPPVTIATLLRFIASCVADFVVDVHGTFARHFLFPELPKFLERYPDLQVHIGEAARPVDLVREGVDCVLRVGEPQESTMVARRIAMLEDVTCASPGYLRRFGTPKTPDDLEGHRMVGFLSSATGTYFPLELTVDGKLRHVTLPCTVSVVGAETNIELAKLGFGIIQVRRYHVAADITAKKLVPILTDYPPSRTPVSLLYPQKRQLSPRVRVFIDWVTTTLKRRGSELATP